MSEYVGVQYLGIKTEHPPNHVADYHNKPFYAFLSFRTPFKIKVEGGEIVEGKAGQSMLTRPYFHHWHTGVEGHGFRNDWIFLSGELIERFSHEFNIPFNTLLNTCSTELYASLILQIDNEKRRQESHWEANLTMLVRQMFLYISREIHTQQTDEKTGETRHIDRFQTLRNKIQEDLTYPWSNAEMAEMVGLSENHFSVIYKKIFHVSPIEDIIQKRLQYAKLLLANKNITISEVAHQSGFTSLYYFSRIFKKRTGISPKEFSIQAQQAVE